MVIVPGKLPFLNDSKWKDLEASLVEYGSLTKSVESALGELPEALLDDVTSSYKDLFTNIFFTHLLNIHQTRFVKLEYCKDSPFSRWHLP